QCERAVVAGVNLILSPEGTIAISRGRMVAPDGRCKTFDAAADGYVRGEGAGVLILRRLTDAVAGDEHPRAVICGSAVNQNGPSGGLT
ncbi:MAG: beta-ketoacyl synthase N-terminal-like domain-containing protein, partial [Vicinamibacterales bacterium]|nr:beta-ketoacyl synthase N-terminal-like domain-containing protein [Vicinamibacterales bacterium]